MYLKYEIIHSLIYLDFIYMYVHIVNILFSIVTITNALIFFIVYECIEEFLDCMTTGNTYTNLDM